jgi:hypothetical protein
MIVINKKAVDAIVETGKDFVGNEPKAVFSYDSPSGRKAWHVCYSWEEADEVALKGASEKIWEREGRPEPEAEPEPEVCQPAPAHLDEVHEQLKAAYDREWKGFTNSGIFDGRGRNRPLYHWNYLRPQVQAWAVLLEKKMRKAADKLKRLSEVDLEVVVAWLEADVAALKTAFEEAQDAGLAARAMDVALNCVLLTDRVMKLVLEDPDGDAGEGESTS